MGHSKLKKKSKRGSLRKINMIKKRVKEANKKKGKTNKEDAGEKKSSLVVVPKLCPFKEKTVQEMNEAKAQEKEHTLQNEMESEDTEQDELVQLLEDAKQKAQGFPTSEEENIASVHKMKMESVTLAKEFKKVVAAADIILEVVDARDPLGTRCKVVEETVLQYPEKRLVIVVNKADLVPRDVLESWLTYLRQSRPAVPFKASVQQQSQKLGRKHMMKKNKNKANMEKHMNVSSSVGVEFLMRLLSNYRRNKNIMTSITVGVVGVPNVGKSSVINSLKRSKSCKVGAEPGVTRTLQSIQVSKNVKILDSPGIIMADPIVKNNTILCLKNLVSSDKLYDPVQAAQAILIRATKEQMKQLYGIPDYSTPEEFLLSLARRLGLLKKKGIPDISKAARSLVQDWNRGKIRFYTLPPENQDNCISAQLIVEHDKEFRIDELEIFHENILDKISTDSNSKHIVYVPFNEGNNEDDENIKQMSAVVVDSSVETKKKGKLRWRKKNKSVAKTGEFVMVPRQQKLLKLAAKKKRKEESRMLAKAQLQLADKSMDVD